ncbi:MAG: DUF975 family protein [Oscillospiraceae bacterium]|nr:DUF975 family protein [Oscillospiraceae bacterium]
MYSHILIKKNAWAFRQSNNEAILAALLTTVLSGVSSSVQYRFNNYQSPDFSFGLYLFVLVFSLALSIFVCYPVTVGSAGWFSQAVRGNKQPVSSIFNCFSQTYKSTVILGVIKSIYIFAWSLLFLIPGIIKSYAYSMAEYIKSDNPDLSYDQVLELSNRITKGHKGDLFYLDLSFTGWYIVGTLTCLIGNILLVSPYYLSAKAFAYEMLKSEAISSGTASAQEFGGYGQSPFTDYKSF